MDQNRRKGRLMTSIRASKLRRGDIVTVPATITGTVTAISPVALASGIRLTVQTPDGAFTLTVPTETSIDVNQITLEETR